MNPSTIFISYSHHDKAWVCDWLQPRLEAAGLKVLIDTRDFAVGAPVLVNIEAAVEASRRTLLVLTPHWVASEWTSFESLLLQTGDPTGLRGRLLPLMLETCEPPKRLGIFTYADFRAPPSAKRRSNACCARSPRMPARPGRPAGPACPTSCHPPCPRNPISSAARRNWQTIADAISPEARTWGALIDGPGGIGKTALAVRAGHLAPAQDFAVKIFLSAKVRELTPAGEQPLADFMLPNYMALLAELARELGEADIARCDPGERANTVRRALAGKRALIVIDNLETLDETERMRVFQFLGRLPEGNKAIVTSRRRSDVDARAIRLDRLALCDALSLLDELAKRNPRLARATAAERQALYELTHGNPLLIQWTAGQLGRGQCRTVADACDFLRAAPAGNDPLEYIFGDLVDSFSESETKALAALAHFTQPAQVKWVADLAGLAVPATLTALEDLADRALVVASPDGTTFLLPPLAALFLRRRRPEAVAATAGRLTDRVYALALENGYKEYDRFSVLEAEWPAVAAALLLFLDGPNDRLQTLCDALTHFLNFPGAGMSGLALFEQAEAKAVAVQDWLYRGWRAYEAGHDALAHVGRPRRCCAGPTGPRHTGEAAQAGARERALRHPPARRRPSVGEGLRSGDRGVQGGAGVVARARSREAEDVAAGLQQPCRGRATLQVTVRPQNATSVKPCVSRSKINDTRRGYYLHRQSSRASARSGAVARGRTLAREALALAEKLGRAELVGVRLLLHCHGPAPPGSPRRSAAFRLPRSGDQGKAAPPGSGGGAAGAGGLRGGGGRGWVRRGYGSRGFGSRRREDDEGTQARRDPPEGTRRGERLRVLRASLQVFVPLRVFVIQTPS